MNNQEIFDKVMRAHRILKAMDLTPDHTNDEGERP